MPKFAYFDATVSAPSVVLGWYDTDIICYRTLPATTDLLELTPEQWTMRRSGHWAVSGGALVPYVPPPVVIPLPAAARSALAATDITMHRIVEAVALGTSSWTAPDVVAYATYRRALREIVGGGSSAAGKLPTPPPYPAGT